MHALFRVARISWLVKSLKKEEEGEEEEESSKGAEKRSSGRD